MPADAVYVGRPTIWGNPFRITRSSDFHGLTGSWFLMDEHGTMYHPDIDTQSSARQKAVHLFTERVREHGIPISEERIRAELAGHDLVCWCPIREPCHADVLLDIAASPPILSPLLAAACPRCGATSLTGNCANCARDVTDQTR